MTISEMGIFIRVRREYLKLRQEDLSELSGITIKTIHLIESGSGNPSFITIEKLSIVLGLELVLQVKQSI